MITKKQIYFSLNVVTLNNLQNKSTIKEIEITK